MIDEKLNKLLIKASRNFGLREKLLENPKEIGEKYGVTFTPEQLTKISTTANFVDTIAELEFGYQPEPKYPLYIATNKWQVEALLQAAEKRFFDPRITYPVPGFPQTGSGPILYPVPGPIMYSAPGPILYPVPGPIVYSPPGPILYPIPPRNWIYYCHCHRVKKR